MDIGETILGAVLKVVLGKLASREVMNFFRIDRSLMNKLRALMLATGSLLLDAEQKLITNHLVKQWHDELQHWLYRAEEVLDEMATKGKRSYLKSSLETPSLGSKVLKLVPSSYRSISFNKKIMKEMRDIISMLESMLDRRHALGLRENCGGGAPSTVPRTTTSVMEDSEVYGRDQEKEKLLNLLLSFEEAERNKFGVVAIVGMGGIGKTTLAQMVFNDARVQRAFGIKAWICVSDRLDIRRVTKSILDKVSTPVCSESWDLDLLQNKLRSELWNKKFFFVLDDVWNECYEHWQTLQAPFSAGASGSRIIVTTRNDGVASTMCTKPPFPLKLLSDEDAWSLFKRHAFELGNGVSDPSLERIGRKIVQRCKGLPLAVKALGGLLRWKRDNKDWEEILQSTLWDLPQENDVIPALRLSYSHLPGRLKRLFSHCAIFPKGYKIDRKQLVLLWMAEDLVPLYDNDGIKYVGDEYLDQLLSRSFLEQVDESYVTMHDLMHDLAQLVSGNFLARHENEKQTSRNHTDRDSNRNHTRHFSYVGDRYDTFSKFQAIDKMKYLRSFLRLQTDSRLSYQNSDCYLTNKVSVVLKPSLSCLRVLSLSGYENLRLHELIECPKQLRYMDVSRTSITQLPEWVTTLCNLQTLILSDCKHLRWLPTDMWRLGSLRHLDIRGATLLSHMPEQMSKLTSLQALTDFIVGESTGSGIQELRELPDIRGKFAIRGLENLTGPGDVYDVKLSSKKLIDDLELEFAIRRPENDVSKKHKQVLSNLEPPSDVKRLTIKNYVGTEFPNWMDHGCTIYKHMTFLCLHNCLNCDALPPLGQLPSLKRLEIQGMDSIKRVGYEFYGHGICDPYPTLESLSFKNMIGWEEWSCVDVKGGFVCFPCLTYLCLFDCPNLKGDLPGRVPSLVELKIDACGQLSRVLPGFPSVHALEIATSCSAGLTRGLANVASITTLRLSRLVQLVNLPPELVKLSSVIKLYIEGCQNLKSLANVRLPPKVEDLFITDCEVFECLPDGMKSLKHLWLYECPCLRWVPGNSLPTSLMGLTIARCEKFEFPIQMERMHYYTSLTMIDVGLSRFVSFPLGILPDLHTLIITNCEDLEEVYIPEGIDDSNLSSLSSLQIWGCPKLKMIGKEAGRREATELPAPNLTFLQIGDCERVKAVLIEREGEILLPKLPAIAIDKSNSWKMAPQSPSSLRSNLVRFTCLTKLIVREEEGECFPDRDQGWASLPTSLITLIIEECPKLRKVDGNALLSLKSLQRLEIGDCPKLESLAEEGLPPSLGELKIRRCPILEERYKPNKRKYWSRITHIPWISIGEDV